MRLTLKQFKSSGVLVNKYKPLHNLMTTTSGEKELGDFTTDKLSLYPNQIVDVTCQPSYDGTVNLIINDDATVPKIINSKFTKTEGNCFRVITRNQKNQTNVYNEDDLETDTSLFLTSTKFPKVDLYSVSYNGQLKGGTYTFYFKYCDDDYNETDIIAESGQVSVFKGTLTKPATISGCIQDERTDKSITLKLSNLDTAYKKLQVYYARKTGDCNGISMEDYRKIVTPYEFNDSETKIVITGFEEETTSSNSEINTQYNIVSTAKTQTQVQNMLFFGNVSKENPENKDLATISYYIQAELKQKEQSIGNITSEYKVASNDSFEQAEYYNPKNTYYYLGYWPEEMYRIGIVYLMIDGSRTPVYNLRGCNFEEKSINYTWEEYNEVYTDYNGTNYELKSGDENKICYNAETGYPVLLRQTGSSYYFYKKSDGTEYQSSEKLSPISTNASIASKHTNLYASVTDASKLNYMNAQEVDSQLDNTYGVFKNKKYNVLQENGIHPLYYKFTIKEEVKNELKKRNVIGFYFVRQKRLANILGQGLAIGVLNNIHAPVLYDSTTDSYVIESFVDKSDGTLSKSFAEHRNYYAPQYVDHYGLLSVDAMVTPRLQSMYDGEEFLLKKQGKCNILAQDRNFTQSKFIPINDGEEKVVKTRAIYVDEDIPARVIDDVAFSTRLGSSEVVTDFAMWNTSTTTLVYRGILAPFIGTTAKNLQPYELYNITRSNYSSQYDVEYVKIRGNDLSYFFAISDRYVFDEFDGEISLDVYRGDCFSNTVTVRMMRNFTDGDVPVSNLIINPDTWKKNYHGYLVEGEGEQATDYSKINRGDLNTVPLGSWITYKCLSNYNLGLRAIDTSYTDETALMGNPRAFYPVRSMSTRSSCKIEDSHILNEGYNATVGIYQDLIWANVPYTKDLFDNRVMFSNVAATDSFKNGYRVFQGLSYKDIDRQYGAIVKLESWGRDLLCIFEHGIGILPINEKALQSTTTGQSVYLKGLGVLSSDVSVISQDFGSYWKDSIIRTPMGVYGVDTEAKKIWRVSLGSNQMETISDMKVQKFLNDNICLSENDHFPTLALKNVVSHYNNFKGDVMFTFYNSDKEVSWNLCYNERQGKWTTRYSWTPLLSANINNQYYSFDKNRAEIYSIIYNNKNTSAGLRTDKQLLKLYDDSYAYDSEAVVLSLQGFDTVTSIKTKVNLIETSYIDGNTEKSLYITEFPYTETEEDDTGTEITTNYTGFDWLLPINNKERSSILSFNGEKINEWFKSSGIDDLPVYIKMNVEVTMYIDDAVVSSKLKDTIGFILSPLPNGEMILQKDTLLRNAFFVHGRAGVFDEIDYKDASYSNQILPCKWYNKQEPFELEFIVNGDEVGFHKIFNNLVIISNNVQPEELELEVIGDVYQFNKVGIFRSKEFGEDEYQNCEERHFDNMTYKVSQNILNGDVIWDYNLDEYGIRIKQPLFNIKDYGRIAGNIHYKEDSWYITLDPIKFKRNYQIINGEESEIKTGEVQDTRLRDKYIKIRVKYSGENAVIITALKTLYTLSYA